ncbi:MAG: hypothetical protein WBY94_04610 [Polyangiaceae bacterium]
MPIGLLEITIGALLFGAWKKSEKKGVLTPEREKVYKAALAELHVPSELRKLADVFEAQGLAVEATMLRRRADLREQTPEQKRARRDAFDKGLASEDVGAVERLADAFESITATGAAKALRKHAEDVRILKMQKRAAPPSADEDVEKDLGEDTQVEHVAADDPGETAQVAKTEEHEAEVVNGTAKPPVHRLRRQSRTASAE